MRSPTRVPQSRSSSDLQHLGRAYARLGIKIWKRSWTIGSGYVERAADEALKIGIDAKNPREILHALFLGYRNYCMEMAALLPLTIDGLGRDLDRAAARPCGFSGSAADAPLPPQTRVIRDAPVMLPVRIADASQGWALYFVSAERAQAHLAALGELFTVVEVGSGRAALAILGIDYHDTDLGIYREIGVTLLVTPRTGPPEMPGILFLSLTVSDEFNVYRAKPLWGYDKTLAPNLERSYGEAAVRFAVDRNDPTALSVSFPRFGSGRSTEIPSYTYGVIADAGGSEIPHKTLISRSGSGEGVQIGGAVGLQLGDGTQGRCVCHLGPVRDQICVCRMMRDLGLPKRPAANGWTEHMSAQVSGSTPCQPLVKRAAERIESGVVTEKFIVAAAKTGKRLALGKGVVLTPLAKDKAEELGLEIERET